MQMLKVAYDEAKRLLLENREALDKIAAFLIEKETITGKEFMQIFHEVRRDRIRFGKEGRKDRHEAGGDSNCNRKANVRGRTGDVCDGRRGGWSSTRLVRASMLNCYE